MKPFLKTAIEFAQRAKNFNEKQTVAELENLFTAIAKESADEERADIAGQLARAGVKQEIIEGIKTSRRC